MKINLNKSFIKTMKTIILDYWNYIITLKLSARRGLTLIFSNSDEYTIYHNHIFGIKHCIRHF